MTNLNKSKLFKAIQHSTKACKYTYAKKNKQVWNISFEQKNSTLILIVSS